jgi:hypothetical protein
MTSTIWVADSDRGVPNFRHRRRCCTSMADDHCDIVSWAHPCPKGMDVPLPFRLAL